MNQNLILLHGALGSALQLNQIEAVFKDWFVIHSFNFEGHGGRKSPNEFSISLFVQNTLEYMDENKIQKASFFGYSMGGYVALKFSTLYPDRVQKIFTYGTKFDWTPESAEKEIKMLHPEKIEEKVPAFASQLEKLHFPLDWKENMRKTARMMLNLGEEPELREFDLAALKIPVTIGIGSNDHMVSLEETEHVVNLIPLAKLQLFEESPHIIEKVDAGLLSEKIRKFLIT